MCLSCFAKVDKARVNFGKSIVDGLDMLKIKLGMVSHSTRGHTI